MAKALIVWVCYLLTEFLAHTLIVLRFFYPAGAITARFLQALLDGFNDFRIRIQLDFHDKSPRLSKNCGPRKQQITAFSVLYCICCRPFISFRTMIPRPLSIYPSAETGHYCLIILSVYFQVCLRMNANRVSLSGLLLLS